MHHVLTTGSSELESGSGSGSAGVDLPDLANAAAKGSASINCRKDRLFMLPGQEFLSVNEDA
jgi:hypothetical protein